MRKHFLILMLLTLLPLTGWAEVAYRVVVNNGNNLVYQGSAWTVADLQGKVKIQKYDTGAPETVIDTYSTGITVSLLKKNGTSTYLDEFEDVGIYTFKVEHATAFPSGTDATVTVAKCPVTVRGALQSATTKVFYGEAWDDIKAKVKATYAFTTAPFDDQSTAEKKAFVKTFTDQFDGVVDFPASASTYAQWPAAKAAFTFSPTVVELNETYTNFVFTAAASAEVAVQGRDLSTGVNITANDIEYHGVNTVVPVLKDKVRPGTAPAKYTLNTTDDYTVYYYENAAAAAADAENTNALGAAPVNAGTYVAKMVGKGNYAGAVTREFTISKASVDIETIDKTSVYGAEPAELTAVYGGWKNNEGTAAGVTYNTPGTETDPKAAFETGITHIKYYLQKQGVNVALSNTTEVGTYDIVALPVNRTGAGTEVSPYVYNIVNTTSDNIFKNYEVLFFNSGKYTVTAKPLTVTIKDQTKKYGIPHILDDGAEVQVDADNFSTFFEDFWTGGKVGTDQIATYPKVKRDGDKVVIVEGTAFGFRKPTSATSFKDVTTFYNLTINSGNYVQQEGQINVKAKSTSVIYGATENLAAIELNVSGGNSDDMEAAKPYLIKALKVKSTGNTEADGTGDDTTYPNVGYYELYFDEDILEANQEHWAGYTIKPAKSTYQIKKRQLTKIEVKAQSLNQGDGPANLVLDKNFVTITADGYPLTPEDNEKLFNATDGEFVLAFNESTAAGNVAQIPGSTPVNLNDHLDGSTPKKLNNDAHVGTYVKAIKIKFRTGITALTNFELPKYVATPGADPVVIPNLDAEYADAYTMGALTVSEPVASVQLARVAISSAADVTNQKAAATTTSAFNKIKTNAGNKVSKVTFTLPGHTMKAETWYSWVLPFATTVKDISKAFGYAVVDILGEDGASSADDVKFKLHMGDIKANQPFILKVYKDIKPEEFASGTTTVNFTDVTIINANAEVTDANGNKFIGTYSGKYGLESNEYLFRLGVNDYSKGGAASSIRPLGAYIQFATPSNAHTIYIEEPDGSTTAISSIAADGEMIPAQGWYTLNGVKLQGMPTEKGVYINNGKKVVIK